MSENLKEKTIKGVAWSGADKLLTTIVNFVISILIARLLMPSDYGVVGIIYVFIVFSEIFIDGGLSVALIQKHRCTSDDYNTAFLYNLVMSVSLYAILFIIAPYIAKFYDNNEIISLLRVLALSIIVSAFSSIQNTRLQIAVDFKKISISSVISNIVSGGVGLLSAFKGLGVWALVVQNLSYAVMKTITLNILSKWRPSLVFSKKTFKELFSFGYKLILSNVLGRVYDNLYPLIIGKLFPMSTLGYYSRAQHFANLPISILRDIFQRVSFPIMSSIKDDRDRLMNIYRLYIKMSSAIVFPVMFIFILVAHPLILILLTEKWLDAYPFLQILCFGFMFNHISSINLNLLYVKGRSDWALKLEVLKKTVAVSILLLSLLGGIWGICIGQALYGFIATILNSKYTRLLINLSYFDQLKDFGKVWVYAFVPFILSKLIFMICSFGKWDVLFGIVLYALIYAFSNYLFKSEIYLLCIKLIHRK